MLCFLPYAADEEWSSVELEAFNYVLFVVFIILVASIIIAVVWVTLMLKHKEEVSLPVNHNQDIIFLKRTIFFRSYLSKVDYSRPYSKSRPYSRVNSTLLVSKVEILSKFKNNRPYSSKTEKKSFFL